MRRARSRHRSEVLRKLKALLLLLLLRLEQPDLRLELHALELCANCGSLCFCLHLCKLSCVSARHGAEVWLLDGAESGRCGSCCQLLRLREDRFGRLRCKLRLKWRVRRWSRPCQPRLIVPELLIERLTAPRGMLGSIGALGMVWLH